MCTVSPSRHDSGVPNLSGRGWVTRTRDGRRNRYAINTDGGLRHRFQADHTIGELLAVPGRLRPTKRRKAA